MEEPPDVNMKRRGRLASAPVPGDPANCDQIVVPRFQVFGAAVSGADRGCGSAQPVASVRVPLPRDEPSSGAAMVLTTVGV